MLITGQATMTIAITNCGRDPAWPGAFQGVSQTTEGSLCVCLRFTLYPGNSQLPLAPTASFVALRVSPPCRRAVATQREIGSQPPSLPRFLHVICGPMCYLWYPAAGISGEQEQLAGNTGSTRTSPKVAAPNDDASAPLNVGLL